MDRHQQENVFPTEPRGEGTRSTSRATHGAGNSYPSAEYTGIRGRFSPWRFLIITIGGIFLAEVLAMLIVYPYQNLPYYLQTLIDASVMIVMISPLVYFLSLRPLVLHIKTHQRMEESLRQSEARFAKAFQSSPAALSITRLGDGEFIDVNEGFLHLSGHDREEVIGHTPTELGVYVNPEEWTELKQQLLRRHLLGQDRGVRDYEMTTRTKSGEVRSVLISTEGIELDGEYCILTSIADITERKQAEDLNRRLSRIVEQTEDTVVVTNREGVIEYVNPAFERLTGYTKEEALGKTPRLLKSGIHDNEFYHELWNTILKGNIFQNEIANCRKNGEVFYEFKTITPLRNGQGNLTHFVATGKDITERKRDEEKLRRAYDELELRVQDRTEELRIAISELEDEIGVRRRAEDALRQSEDRLNRAQEIAHLGSWELDLVKNRLTWSDEVYRIFGLQPQEFCATYEAFLEAIHPDDRAAVDNAYSGSIREGRDSYQIEHRIVKRSSGEIRIVHEKCGHFRNEDGQIIRSAGMVHDITERKQIEEALRLARDELELRVQERTAELAVANRELSSEINERKEVERQLRIQTTAMEAAANGIIITDSRGNIQWMNPALTQITGYTEAELLGQSTRIFNSGQHDAGYFQQMWNTILSGQVWRGETINRRKDAGLYVEEQTITPILGEDGKIQHFIAIKQDISQRKKAEEELERRSIELQALSRAEHNQRQFAEALVDATLVLNKSMNLDEVLPLILEEIKEVIPYQLANVALLDGEFFYDASHRGDRAWPEAQIGIKDRFLLKNFPLLEKMRQSGQPILVLDTRKEPGWVTIEGLEWSRSFLSAPLLVEQQVIGFVNLFADQPGFFTREMRDRLAAFAAHATVAIQNAWLFEQVRAGSERLQSLSRRLVEVQENERHYIARELHDEAGQVLTSLLVDLQLLEKRASQPNAVLKIVAEMEKSLNGVIENLHRMAMALRPASLDHLGLVAALRQHVESVGEKHGLKVSFRAGKVRERLLENVETVLYRIVQEALTNVVRHAHATRADVILTVRDDRLIVIIEDDGIGFDPDSVLTGDHLGLFGLRERTEMIGGKLMIESTPGKGTTIMLEVGYADSIVARG